MKTLNKLIGLITLSLIMTSFSQCSSAQKLQEKAPTNFGQVYCQTWVAGVRGGGSGINIFIPVTNFSVKIDSVYFRGKKAKLNIESDNKMVFVGRIKTDLNNEQHDVMVNSEVKEEQKEEAPKETIPFELQNNECVVSYIDNGAVKYYKIENVVDKPLTSYPMQPRTGGH